MKLLRRLALGSCCLLPLSVLLTVTGHPIDKYIGEITDALDAILRDAAADVDDPHAQSDKRSSLLFPIANLYKTIPIVPWNVQGNGAQATEELFHSPFNVAAMRTNNGKFGTEVELNLGNGRIRPDSMLLGPYTHGVTLPTVGFSGEMKSQIATPEFTRTQAWEQVMGSERMFTFCHKSVNIVVFAVLNVARSKDPVRMGFERDEGGFKELAELNDAERKEMLQWVVYNAAGHDLRVELRMEWRRVQAPATLPDGVECRSAASKRRAGASGRAVGVVDSVEGSGQE